MKAVGIPLAATLLAALVASRALLGGFLADDYYLGHEIAERAAANPGFAGSFSDAFAHAWSEKFQLFRPLTVLTIQSDYALHGADGGRHHLTHVILWALLAFALAGALCRAVGTTNSWLRAAAILLFGTCPAAVEALGWLVARGDLLVGLFGLLATWHLAARPEDRWRRALVLVPAFLSSDAAIVLPPLLMWADFWLGEGLRGRSTRWGEGRALIRRHLPSLLLLLAYFGLRLALFGAIGSKYNGRTYGEFLADPGTPARAIEALRNTTTTLFVPVNQELRHRLFPTLPEWLPALLFLLPWTLLIAVGSTRVRRGLLRPLIAFLPWIYGPVLMLAPLFSVQPSLEESRILVVPLIGFLLLMGRLVLAALQASPRFAGAALVLLLLAGTAAMQLNLESYRRAADRARQVRADFDVIPAGQRVVLLRVADDPQITALSILDGAYVLSAGLNKALRTPFRDAPGVHSDPIPVALEPALATYVERGAPDEGGQDARASRPWVATCRLDETGAPRIAIIGRGGYRGTPPVMKPAHAASHERSEPLRFEVDGPIGRSREATRGRLIVTEPGGQRVTAEFPAAAIGFEDGRFRLTVPGEALKPLALVPETLGQLPVPVLLWWIELENDEETVTRSPYAVVRLVP